MNLLALSRCAVTPSLVLAVMLAAHSLSAAPNDWAEGSANKSDGASREFYNSAAQLPWQNAMGDWRDAKNAAQGREPYAKSAVAAAQKGKFVEWDVTSLVQEWSTGKYPNQGFMLRSVDGGAMRGFSSREHAETAQRPQLVLTGAKGSATLAARADTYLEKSTYRSQGHLDNIRVSDANPTLIRFDLADASVGKIDKAVLRLYNSTQAGGGTTTIGVFRCAQGQELIKEEPTFGLAAKYPGDKGISKDPDVIFFTDFEAENWQKEWTQALPVNAIKTVTADADRKFEPLQGKALSSIIAKGSLTGLNLTYQFKKKIGAEPEEIYFRYYLRLGNDWNQTVQGGKLPGISGTYGKAGWGGRKVNGKDGWSARGSFVLTIPEGNPLGGLQPIGTYCYHTDMPTTYGDIWIWSRGYRGYLEKNRWYCIEQYVKMNTPGQKDGILRVWIDGGLAFEKTDLRYRLVDTLKIEQVWMNVYHGGTVPSPYDQHTFVDNVVFAKKYIGPMK